jgi:hypothetical protein
MFCSPPVSSDGLTVRQYNTLWVTRVILCVSVCICFGALFCASKVVSDAGTRRHVKVGKWLFFAAGTFSMSKTADVLSRSLSVQGSCVACGTNQQPQTC